MPITRRPWATGHPSGLSSCATDLLTSCHRKVFSQAVSLAGNIRFSANMITRDDLVRGHAPILEGREA